MQTNETMNNSIGARRSRSAGIRFPDHAVWLPLAVGVVFGIIAAILLIQQNWMILFAVLLIVPVAALFYAYPFVVVLIWLLIFPFFLKEIMPGARAMYWLLHRFMIPGALLLLVGLSMLGIRKVKTFRFGLADWAMIAFLVYSVANILLMTDRPIAQVIYLYDRIVVPYCMYWLIRLIKPDRMDLNRLAPVALVIILTQGTIGVLSWFAPDILPPRWLGRLNERTTGTFGNPAVFTTTMLFSAVLLVQTFWETNRRMNFKMVMSLLAVGLAFFFVFFSFSRGSWLGAIPVWAGLFILYPKFMIRLTLLGSMILAPLMAVGPLAEYTTFAEDRLTTETTAEGRIIGGAATIRMIEERPGFGWGYGNHELYDEQFRDRVFGLMDSKEQSSHNTYLLIASEIGIPGLLLYYLPAGWLLFLTIINWKRFPKRQVWNKSMMLMLWLLIFDHALVGFFTDMIQSNFFNTVIWWFMLGMIANINEIASSARATRPAPTQERG